MNNILERIIPISRYILVKYINERVEVIHSNKLIEGYDHIDCKDVSQVFMHKHRNSVVYAYGDPIAIRLGYIAPVVKEHNFTLVMFKSECTYLSKCSDEKYARFISSPGCIMNKIFSKYAYYILSRKRIPRVSILEAIKQTHRKRVWCKLRFGRIVKKEGGEYNFISEHPLVNNILSFEFTRLTLKDIAPA